MHRLRRLPIAALLAGLVGLLGAPRTVTAQADPAGTDSGDTPAESAGDAAAAAKLLYDEAVLLYEQGDFVAAAQALERAHALDPHPVLAFNIGRAWDDAGRFDIARTWYLAALADGGLDEVERRRAAKALERIENTEATLEHRVQALKVTESRLQVTSTRDAARVFIGDTLVGETPFATIVEPGAYTIRVEADRHAPFVEVVELEPGETLVVRAALEPESLMPWVYGLGGLSAVSLAVGITGDVLAVQAYDDARASRGDAAALEDHRAFGKGMRVMAIVGYSAAAVAGVSGLVLLLVELTGSETQQYRSIGADLAPVSFDLGPGGATLRVTW